MKRRHRLTAERFWSQVDQRGTDECWPWTGPTTTGGYGQAGIPGVQGSRNAHRAAWFWTHGELPAGPVDHTCHTLDAACTERTSCTHRLCCNPAHLEAVTVSENNRRRYRDRCAHDHPLSGDNLRIDRHGHRRCRACNRAAQLRLRARKELSA